ncbi:hypothetical protein SISSUDRAFT_1126276 [Sistotremastrum suecicum HHB10207 ss-3]|uniref:ATP synthase subunit 4 n=1 Tax=Sistotremastrum suecicum HHB10207 ss-3 TaxID=1314776 RepID=A0A166GIM2_9AGAM|nr:hypothetical protein SISSUDRAFT_1126276 [Sistotremastrum suecicum HHB10207 ss-3]
MASRIAVKALRAPVPAARLAPRLFSTTPVFREQQPPAEKASSIINSLPSSNNLVTKTGTVILGSGLLATAISQELYVANEETVIAVGFLIIFTFIARSIREPYSQWAEGHINRIKSILEGAREEHTSAVKSRISQVTSLQDLPQLTSSLFELSKETAKLEAQSFELRQKVAIASEIKQVLDSWVRFEQSEKEKEQDELTRSVIAKVMKGLGDEKTQKDILASAIAEVEQLVKNKAV